MADHERDPVDQAETESLLGSLQPRRGTIGLPRRIGPYEVVERLGQGGMGTVYLAREVAPLDRLVAVKVIRSSLDTREALRRFEAEQRALGRMTHPGIARVYATGSTDDGEPYIAMEHVDGRTILATCDEARLDLDERLDLFCQVCAAVQHAHEKGVIHRDLKPSNILVTEVQGSWQPKIIDFGIAKAVGEPLVDGPTLTGQRVVGTPGYLSPEALLAPAGLADLDTRTDVYALGLVLFRLLVGEPPFPMEGLSLVEALRVVTDEDPPTPSGRLLALGPTDREGIAAARGTSAPTLARRVRGDLDWICSRALARDRADRYPSAAALADDLKRHLHHEPVSAGPPSRLYRLGKLIRRHRGTAAALVLLLASLVGGLVARTAEARRANREAATAREVSRFLVDLFALADPQAERKGEITARELLARGRERIDTALVDQPATRASLMRVMGDVHFALGLYGEASPLYEEALALQEKALGPRAPEVEETLDGLSSVYVEQGRFEEAERATRRQLGLIGDDDRHGRGDALSQLAIILHNQGRLEEAIPLQEEAIRDLAGTGEVDEATLNGLNHLATLYLDLGNHRAAEPILRRVVALREEVSGPMDTDLAQNLNNLGLVLMERGAIDEAVEVLERAVAIRDEGLGPDHVRNFWGLRLLGEAHRVRGDLAAAERALDRAVAVQASLGPDHPFRALTLESLGNLRIDQGRVDEAQDLLERCVEVASESLAPDHPSQAYYRRSLARLYALEEKTAEAAPLFEEALAIFAATHGTDHAETVATREELEALGSARSVPTGRR